MLRVVSNTTPLLALLKINKLNLLHQVYDVVHVPEAVYHEIQKGATKKYYIDLKSLPWIKITPVQDVKAKNFFSDLDEGEAETIILRQRLRLTAHPLPQPQPQP